MPAAARYCLATSAVAVAMLLTIWLREEFRGTPNALFFCAIIFSSWSGGFGPGLLSSVLSILAIKYFSSGPVHNFVFTIEDAPRFSVFLVAGLFISWLGDRQRGDEQALMRMRDNLEGAVQARTVALTTANAQLTGEIAERKRAESELERLNRALKVRSACNQAVNRCSEEMDLLARACRGIVDVGGYALAWVGYAENDDSRTVRPVAQAGETLHYLDDLVVTWGEDAHGQGPAGAAIRTGRSVVCNELSSDPRMLPWCDRAEKFGLKSSVALPLAADGQTIGALIIYAKEAAAFDAQERKLLLETANDLTHGVALLRTRHARERAEEALKKTEIELDRVARVTAMGELSASIAHEVNQPLAAVVTNGNASLRWLAADPPNFDEVREAIQRIIRDGTRASDVIARIRTLLRKSEPVSVPLDINDTIREIVTLAQGEAARRGATIEMEFASDLPAVVGDRVQLQQVLLNLLINALDAMNGVTDRPRVARIGSRAMDGKAVLVGVEDTGVGLDAGQSAKLFDAFYTTKPGGLGMGLSISRSIVEAHGGRLWATPNAGPGATFQFTLPSDMSETA
jgi:signal transduction histidine kinase